MCRNGPVAWPPRIPDLNRFNFYFWAYTNDCVLSTVPIRIGKQKTTFHAAIISISDETLQKVVNDMKFRLGTLMCLNGAH